MIRIIGLDLDGTLLNDKKEICKENIEVLQKVKEQGVKVVLCSGRAPEGMQKELRTLDLKKEGQFGLGLNGGVLYDAKTGEILQKRTMGAELVKEVIKIGRTLTEEVNIQLYTGEQIVVERRDETTKKYEDETNSHVVTVDNLMDWADRAVKLVFYTEGEADESLQTINDLKRRVEPLLPEGSQCAISAPYLLEFFHVSVDKGRGMRGLAEYLGIPMEEVLCVGDQENDVPMLKEAGVAVVMANGAPEVKKLADYVTQKDNNEGGVAEAAEKFILSCE